MPGSKPFAVGDIVLSPDQGKLYEAKILRLNVTNGVTRCFIHYQGWARKYDIWLEENMLAHKNDEADCQKLLQKARESWNPSVKKADKETVVKIGKFTVKVGGDENKNESANAEDETGTEDTNGVNTRNGTNVASSTKKRKDNFQDETKNLRLELLQKDLVDEHDEVFTDKLDIPHSLKKHLVDDWTLITQHEKRLLKLPKPSNQNIRAIIDMYLLIKKKGTKTMPFNDLQQLLEGLRIQFDMALPNLLLYRQEHPQYHVIMKKFDRKLPSEIFGAEHLIRLLQRMPKMLSGAVVPEPELNKICQNLVDFYG